MAWGHICDSSRGRPPRKLAIGPRSQAFRLGEKAYAVQFHLEVTPDMIEEWAEVPPTSHRSRRRWEIQGLQHCRRRSERHMKKWRNSALPAIRGLARSRRENIIFKELTGYPGEA